MKRKRFLTRIEMLIGKVLLYFNFRQISIRLQLILNNETYLFIVYSL